MELTSLLHSWLFLDISADVVTIMGYPETAERKIRIWKTPMRSSIRIPCGIIVAAELVGQYLWMDWRPRYKTSGRENRTGLYYLGDIDVQDNLTGPRPRSDDYLLLVGFFFLPGTFVGAL